MFCYVDLIDFLSSFAIISLKKRELVVLRYLSSCCQVAIGVLCHFLAVSLVSLHCVFVGFPCKWTTATTIVMVRLNDGFNVKF